MSLLIRWSQIAHSCLRGGTLFTTEGSYRPIYKQCPSPAPRPHKCTDYSIHGHLQLPCLKLCVCLTARPEEKITFLMLLWLSRELFHPQPSTRRSHSGRRVPDLMMLQGDLQVG